MIVGPEAADLLAALHAACFPPGERWDAPAMGELLSMPGCLAVVHARDDTPVGLVLARIAADEAELLTIGIVPEHRRHGDGAALLHVLRTTLATRGVGRLFLEVAVGNLAALALYRNQGFTEVGRRRHYYPNRDDALVMAAGIE